MLRDPEVCQGARLTTTLSLLTSQRCTGILKNSNSYQLSPPNSQQTHSPTEPSPAAASLDRDPISLQNDIDPRRPSLPHQASEKEIVLQNTLANAGPRRNSSNARGSISRRQSRTTNEMDVDENSPRLRWDEANLYLNEQERPATMKIDEPKTPFVKESDLPEDADDEEVAAIDPKFLNVDELDKAQDQPGSHRGRGSAKVGAAKGETDIPDLDLGEAEPTSQPMMRSDSSEKRVIVDPTAVAEDGKTVHAEDESGSASAEAQRKHREFEERRKKHYEIPPGALRYVG